MTHESQNSGAYLLGMAMGYLFDIQNHLVQGHEKEALTKVNDALRELKPLVEKHIYNIEKPEVQDDAAKE